ncbi:MAG: hypothetical protein LBC61_01200 [Candidatus Peribacteria bacterium]|nr:hypothetical protein [Candidatus Peribacteria bacterium]
MTKLYFSTYFGLVISSESCWKSSILIFSGSISTLEVSSIFSVSSEFQTKFPINLDFLKYQREYIIDSKFF